MSIETDGVDTIEALLASGKLSDSSSIAEIEAALNGEQPAASATTDADKAAEAGKTAEADKPATETSQAETAAGETQAADKATATDGKPTAETTSSARDQQTGQVEGSEADDGTPFSSHPIFGVLKGTRTNLTEARNKLQEVQQERDQERQKREQVERELEDLKRTQASQAASTRDVQAAATAAGIKGNIETIDVSKLRDDFPPAIVDAIEALQKQNATLNQQLTQLTDRGAKTEEERAQEALQADIDSVPALSGWQAEGKTKWRAACALDDALRDDPEWKGKSRVERYQEIAKQLGGQPQQQQTTSTETTTTAAGTKAKADAALAKAEQAAVPLSHSGLPTGSAPAQSETEALERLDVTQIADKMANMTDDQINAMLSRVR